MDINISENTRVIKITSFDILSLKYQKDVIYACTDTKKLYSYNGINLIELNIISILTDLDRRNNTHALNNRLYYVWETNEIWYYNSGQWIIKLGSYTPSYSAVSVGDDSLDEIYSNVLDNNGLLGDGSVVVRDYNRIIKGRLYINSQNNDFIISSFLGGGVRIFPSGESTTSFDISRDEVSFIGQNNEKIMIIDGEYYIRYTEPDSSESGLYKVWTERDFTFDNLRNKIRSNIGSIVSDLENYKVSSTGESVIYDPIRDIYYNENDEKYTYDAETNKLIDSKGNGILLDDLKKKMFDIDVKYLGGKPYDQYSTIDHKHTYEDVYVDEENIRDYFINYISNSFYHNDHIGLSINREQNAQNVNKYILSINNKLLKFKGGVSGQAVLDYSSDFEVDITVNPEKHQHKLIEDQISGFTEFKNSVLSKDDFNKFHNYLLGYKFDGNYSENSPLVSSVKLPNRLLLLDDDANLPADITGCSESTKSLSQDIQVKILDNHDATAVSLVINKDLSESTAHINIEPYTHDHEQYSLASSIGSPSLIDVDEAINKQQFRKLGIAPLDTNGKVPLKYLPDHVLGTLQFQSSFDPSLGYPVYEDSTSKTGYKDRNGNDFDLYKGQYWVAVSDPSKTNIIDGQEYLTGDWIIYDGTNWVYLDNSGCVESVNGQSGVVTIDTDSINAINKNMIFDEINNPNSNTILLLNVNKDSEGNITRKYLECDIAGIADSAISSELSKRLSHRIYLNLSGDVSGNIELDTRDVDNSNKVVINNASLSVLAVDGGYI